VAKSVTKNSITHIGVALPYDSTQDVSLEPMNLTETLRRALIERPGEAGALGSTWSNRDDCERQAAQFCEARPAACVSSAKGDYCARVYELPGDLWGIVVWYTHSALTTKSENSQL
jgi:hypothetical protein